MRYIELHYSGGPVNSNGQPDTVWLAEAQALTQKLIAAPDKAARDAIIDANEEFWGRLRDWLLGLSHEKCWYSEARSHYGVLEIEHFRPKKSCRRDRGGSANEGYWWLAFDWKNYRLCGKIGNAKKGVFFPLAKHSLVATYNGLSIANEIPLLLDPSNPGDPDLLSFNEDGACGPHADADQFTQLRVNTTAERLNLNQGRLKKARQRIWVRCWQLIDDCRELVRQIEQAPGPADFERLNRKKEELRRMARSDSEFSAVARDCLAKSNIGWASKLAHG